MICILSKAEFEVTTEEVIDWLRSWRIPHVRLNVEDMRTSKVAAEISRDRTTFSCKLGAIPVDLERIKVVWYRRWGFYHEPSLGGEAAESIAGSAGDRESRRSLIRAALHFRHELRTISHYIFANLSAATWLNDPVGGELNKFSVLKLAAECGLDVPDTIVSTDRAALSSFAAKHKRVITKALSNALFCRLEGKFFASYTSEVDSALLERESATLAFPSLLQESLEKDYEIRAFYLDGRLSSMAIFSQADDQTRTDFRRYSRSHPNRTVPYMLQEGISGPLVVLMKKLGLNSGSVDLVRTTDGRTVFLEVNPVGQFGMVSQPCNYHLEHAVAGALVRRLNAHEKTIA